MTSQIDGTYGIAFAFLFFALVYLLFKRFVKGGGIKYERYREHRNREHSNDVEPTKQRDISTEVREDTNRQSGIPKAYSEPVVSKYSIPTRSKRKRRLVIRKSRG